MTPYFDAGLISLYNMAMLQEEDMACLVQASDNRAVVKKYLTTAKYFDESILQGCDVALHVWRSVAHRFAYKESVFEIPFALAEDPKLYALDALIIAGPLIAERKDLFAIAEIFTVFYLLLHYFDDHVEHPDKFFSKFDFDKEGDLDAQRGAAPFSFSLISLAIIGEILDSQEVLLEKKAAILSAIYDRLASQTRYFALEKQANLSADNVLEIKARKVSGKTLGILADLLRHYLGLSDEVFKKLEKGMMYLGSMEQITDDMRDLHVDNTLHNANIVIADMQYGQESGISKLTELFNQENKNAQECMMELYKASQLKTILSLPFYPFMIDKQRLISNKGRAI